PEPRGGAMGTLKDPAASAHGAAPEPGQTAHRAVAAAVYAPSVHNTQPWWFCHEEREISVYADADRRLAAADPDGREMLMSCGAAVLTLRLALRHLGYASEVEILPDPGLPSLVAQVRWAERVPATPHEERLLAEIEQRRTHRGTFLPGEL